MTAGYGFLQLHGFDIVFPIQNTKWPPNLVNFSLIKMDSILNRFDSKKWKNKTEQYYTIIDYYFITVSNLLGSN